VHYSFVAAGVFGPELLIVAGIMWIRRAGGRRLISRVPALRSFHVLVLAGAPAVSLVFACIDSRGPFLVTAALIGLCIASCVAMLVGVVKGTAIYRQVRAAKGHACPQCLYELTADAGRCPECGRHYVIEDVIREWRGENVPFDSR
jgi:RNA polymerase subunit RPABC4/transcription elongation factor Spt4